ncbi:MAG TPA: hypothetical protein DCQ90_06425 [Erysipelotrichaceae bacterium]|nr:hypothetical protein [Erysipelotrichaceae bacterium]
MATSNIKGITVEIGGKTDTLQNALQNVNKTSKDLQAELKQVNALLKFDPHNTELLAQKQKLLAQEITTTKGKLETLKTAESQAQEQFKKGKISEEQYRALQREIAGTESKLKGLETQARKANGALSSDQAVSNLKNAGKAVAITAGATVLAFGAIANAAMQEADELQKQSDITGLSVERLQELEYAGNQLGVSLDTITGAQSKLTKSMLAAKNGTIDSAELMLKQKQAAIDVEKAQVNLNDAITKYGKGSLEARDAQVELETKQASQQESLQGNTNAFKTLGIAVTDSQGNLRDSKVVMEEAITALGKMTNETERDALAQQIFGKSAMELNPIIKAGGDSLKSLTDDAKKNGAVMSGDAVKGLDAFGDGIDSAKQSITAIVGEALAKLMPYIDGLIAGLQALPAWIEKNQTLVTLIAIAVGTFVAALIAYNIAAAWGAITTAALAMAAGGLAAAVAFLTSPITLVVLAIGALIAIGVLLWKNWDTISAKGKEIFGGFKTFVTGVFDGIKNGLKGMVNGIIDGLNVLIRGANKLKFDIPSWVPIIGGKKFGLDIPTIPRFDVGTRYLPKDMLIQAHEGEMIVRKSENPYANSSGHILPQMNAKEIAQAVGIEVRKQLEKANIVAVIEERQFNEKVDYRVAYSL